MVKKLLAFFLLISTFSALKAQQIVNGEVVVNINAISGMQFDVVRFSVKPGARVKINFTNADDMSHNFLVTKPGKRIEVVNEALKLEEKGPELNYVPKSDNVLWSIPVVSTNQSAAISFTAPSAPGGYPYVCTFPGHGFIMYGVMYVSDQAAMPDLKSDQNVPPSRREEKSSAAAGSHTMSSGSGAKAHTANHPHKTEPPFLYRIFMDDSGPASIAVSLPKDIAYCWDAGSCRFRYAWTGGFLDNTAIWKGHVDANAKIVGSVFFRESSEYPIMIGNAVGKPVTQFKGYRFIDGYPEFHYLLDGIDVFELIKPKDDGRGIVRNFRIPKAGNTVWFSSNSLNGSEEFTSSAGKWTDGKLKLSAEQAREFSVTMTSYSLVYNRRRK